MLSEARANNRRHDLAGLLRQSVYARLAGYEDVNDQEALSRDPAMRAVIGRKALESKRRQLGHGVQIRNGDTGSRRQPGGTRRHQRGLGGKGDGVNRGQEESSWTWTPRSPRCTASRKDRPTTGTSSPSVTTRCSSSTSTATAKGRACGRATSTPQTAGGACWNP